MTIIVLGDNQDQHAEYVLNRLCEAGEDAEFFDTRDFPSRTTISLSVSRGCGRMQLATGRRLDFSQIDAVYWRNYQGVGGNELPDPEQRHIAANDARSILESWLIDLPTRWINGWQAFQLHQTKPVQLARVAALGIEVPPTLLTNDPGELRDFIAEHPRCVFKPVQGGAHTKRIEPRHLTPEALGRLALAPVTVQAEIVGKDVRVFVAGERVMACEIHTPAIDFRDDETAHMNPVTLQDEVAENCRRLSKALELHWTGIDFKRTVEGRFVFLEANPSPMFLGFEARTGLPLSEALIDLLTQPRT